MSENLTNTVSTEGTKKKPARVSNLPKAQKDLAYTAQTVSEHYNQFPSELLWMSRLQFAQLVVDYTADVEKAEREKGFRHPITGTIEELVNKMDYNLQFIKDALAVQFGKSAKTRYYEEFGMAYISKKWQLPYDHNDRLTALDRLLDALDRHNMSGIMYGSAYWQDIKTQFEDALDRATASDSTRTVTVGVKNIRKSTLRKALNALIRMLQANYPDDYKHRIREWGFQKEKY